MAGKSDKGPERVILLVPSRLLERIDTFRYSRRIPSRAEAIRRLIESSLKAEESR
jgi:metal-responsive CopG/Arc/MetJ family transcriptional regulator